MNASIDRPAQEIGKDQQKLSAGVIFFAILGIIGAFWPLQFAGDWSLIPIGVVLLLIIVEIIAFHQGWSFERTALKTLAAVGMLLLTLLVIGIAVVLFLFISCLSTGRGLFH